MYSAILFVIFTKTNFRHTLFFGSLSEIWFCLLTVTTLSSVTAKRFIVNLYKNYLLFLQGSQFQQALILVEELSFLFAWRSFASRMAGICSGAIAPLPTPINVPARIRTIL